MNLKDALDVETAAKNVGKAKPDGLKRIVDKISPIDLDMIFRSVEISPDGLNAIAEVFKDAINRVMNEEYRF